MGEHSQAPVRRSDFYVGGFIRRSIFYEGGEPGNNMARVVELCARERKIDIPHRGMTFSGHQLCETSGIIITGE